MNEYGPSRVPVRGVRAEWLSRTYATRMAPGGQPAEWRVEWRVEADLVADEPVLSVYLTRVDGRTVRDTQWRKSASVLLTVGGHVPCSRDEGTLLVSPGDVLHTGAAWPLVSWPGGGLEVGLVAKRDTRDSHGRWRLKPTTNLLLLITKLVVGR